MEAFILKISANPLFGLTLTITAYLIGAFFQKATHKPIMNSLLIAYIVVLATLTLFRIPLDNYNQGSSIINLFLSPVTAVLAISIFRQMKLIRKNLLPLLAGTLAGSLTSTLSVYIMSNLLGLETKIALSLVPKCVTSPIAIAISDSIGGIPAITMIGVLISGIGGNILAPTLSKLFHITSPVAQGIATGTSSHALGTSKALEMGDVQGALSSVALTFSAIITVIISLLVF